MTERLTLTRTYKFPPQGNLNASLVDFFLAGTETSSTTLKWCLLFLTRHQDHQEWKLMICSHIKRWVSFLTWLLIGCSSLIKSQLAC